MLEVAKEYIFGKTPNSQVFPDDVFLSQVASVANT